MARLVAKYKVVGGLGHAASKMLTINVVHSTNVDGFGVNQELILVVARWPWRSTQLTDNYTDNFGCRT